MFITTIGGSASNSYATIAEINTYLITTGYDLTLWSPLNISNKKRLAKIACKILDSFPIIGSSADYANRANWKADHIPQALKFPRDKDSQPIYGSAAIPTEVKDTQAELVYFAAKDFAQADPSALKIGELSVKGDFTAKYTAGGSFMSRTIVLFLMRPYIKRGAII
jgi:hypothetical protein